MEEKDREVRIGENKLYFGPDNILYTTIIGDADATTAMAIKAADAKFKDMAEGKVNVLVDVSKIGKSSPEASEMWKEVSRHEKTGKIAVFGMSPAKKTLGSLALKLTRAKDTRVFVTREEALAWLKE